jgi:hypothetical protein
MNITDSIYGFVGYETEDSFWSLGTDVAALNRTQLITPFKKET